VPRGGYRASSRPSCGVCGGECSPPPPVTLRLIYGGSMKSCSLISQWMFMMIRDARSVERFLVLTGRCLVWFALQPSNKNGPVLANQLRVNVIFLSVRRRRTYEDVENQLEALPLDSRPPAPPAKNLRLLSRPESTGERCGTWHSAIHACSAGMVRCAHVSTGQLPLHGGLNVHFCRLRICVAPFTDRFHCHA
jgi:hypothetical protein